MHALGDLVRAGMIRYFALSNHKAWRIAEICSICDRIGIDRPVATQPHYNALNRMAEVEQFPGGRLLRPGRRALQPAGARRAVGQVRAGARAAGRQPRRAQRRAHDADRMAARSRSPIAQKLKAHAEALGMTASQFALAWVLENRLVTSVICGPRTEAQLLDYIGAIGRRLPAASEALVDGLVAPGHPSTPGYRDPMEPVEGRHNWHHKLEQAVSKGIAYVECRLKQWTLPTRTHQTINTLADLNRSKRALIAENMFLRQQLIVLERQVERPRVTQRDQQILVLLASRLQLWRDALIIVKPDTLIGWHRLGFKLYWRRKSRVRQGRPPIPVETIALIKAMCVHNRMWRAKRIQERTCSR